LAASVGADLTRKAAETQRKEGKQTSSREVKSGNGPTSQFQNLDVAADVRRRTGEKLRESAS
jgi:hypothetical protein